MNLNVLFITISYLSGNEGGIYASRTHINLFAELSNKMTLLYPHKEGKGLEGINEGKMECIPVKDSRNKLKKIIDLCFGKVHRFENIAKSYIDSKHYDIVVFDSSVVSSNLITYAKIRGKKVITIHHNYQIEYVLGDCSFPLIIPILFWTKIYEKKSVKFSDLNLTLTPQDVELLSKHYDRKAKFSVLGVFEYQYKDYPLIKETQRGHRFIITGSLATKQTEDSLIPWIKEYYPILKKTIPNLELTIAGRNPSEKLKNIIVSAGIKLVISPLDMFEILKEHDYYICPTDRGGGLKLRIMDGFKAGLPVITHSVSARGYEKLLDEGLLCSYNSIDTFIQSIKSVTKISLTHEDIQKKYVELYSFEAGLLRLKTILNENFK